MIQVFYSMQWWLVLEVIGLISFPLVSRVCSHLGDRGYAISKIVGLVIWIYFVWMIASLKLLPFGYPNLFISLLLMALISLYIGRKNLLIRNWPRRKIVLTDLVFTIFFVFFVLIMVGRPDIYYGGAGDSFFNHAFTQSIGRGGFFPPLDPWFAGETISYYYGGHVLVTALSKVAMVPLPVAFNLAQAMFLSLAAGACYGLGFNLTTKKRYGLLTALFVCIVGFASGVLQLLAFIINQDVWGYHASSVSSFIEWLLWFDFMHAGWLIEGALTLYPYYSFLMSDLHSYFMSMPFQVMFITLMFAWFQKSRCRDGITDWYNILEICILGVCLGFFCILNTWEYPTYIFFTVLAFVILRISPSIRGTVAIPVMIVALSFVLYMPHLISGDDNGVKGLEMVVTRTSIGRFLEFGALFLFATLSLLLILWIREIICNKSRSWIAIFVSTTIIIIVAITVIAIFVGFPLLVVVVPFGLLSLYFISKSKPRTPREFMLLLFIISAALIFMGEFIAIDDALGVPYERFNTIMKVYMQLWIFFGISAAGAVFYVLSYIGRKTRIMWLSVLAVFILVSLIHPLASTTSLLSGRNTSWGATRGTLDGMAYIERENKGDYDAIKWINKNIDGSPVILEAVKEGAELVARISTFTGLPTVLGEEFPEAFWGRGHEVYERSEDVARIYSTGNNSEALDLLKKYDVKYIYIGTKEQEKYDEYGLRKFVSQHDYEVVYEYEGVTIYKVRE